MIAAPLQQHENVLQLQVDLGVQGHLDVYDWGRAEGQTDTTWITDRTSKYCCDVALGRFVLLYCAIV